MNKKEGTDYFLEMKKARKEYYKRRLEFSNIIDEWADKHEEMGDFHIGLDFRDYNEVKVHFNGEVNRKVLDMFCEEFNLAVFYENSTKSMGTGHSRTIFNLRHKDEPY